MSSQSALLKISLCIFSLLYAAASFCFHDSLGRFIPSQELKNKWIIVNYWAEWCDSCIEEIPELNSFYKNNQDKNILILGVNYDKLPNPLLHQATQKAGIQFPVLQEDPGRLWRLEEVTMLPTTFVINPDGDVVRKIIGPNTEQSLLKVVHNRLYGKKANREKKNPLV